jgi:hypothetical protein
MASKNFMRSYIIFSELLASLSLSNVRDSINYKNTTFRKLDLFPSAAEVVQLFLRDPTGYVSSPTSPEDGNRSSFRNAVFSSFYNTGRCTKSNVQA